MDTNSAAPITKSDRERERTMQKEKFPHSEMNVLDLTTSKTSQCTEYHFVDQRTSNRYLFIDTPGMIGTHGIQHDEMNIKNVLAAVGKLNGLSAVITVINGSVAIMAPNMQKILTHLHGRFTLDNCSHLI